MDALKLEKSSFFVFMSQLLCRHETHKCGDIVLKRHKPGDIGPVCSSTMTISFIIPIDFGIRTCEGSNFSFFCKIIGAMTNQVVKLTGG
jgi:hypothetical protein